MISIIVPVYNIEKNLEKYLRSIKNQSLNDWDYIVVVDDGLLNNSKVICKKYINKDFRLKYYYQRNCELSAARNKGIEEAIGDYICFIDSDDCVEKIYFEEMNNVYRKFNYLDLVICGYFNNNLPKIIN